MAAVRPLTLGEILDRSIQLLRGNFLLFAGIAFLPSAIEVLISGGASLFFSSQLPVLPSTGHAPNTQFLLSLFLFLVVFFLVGVPVLLSVFALALGALNYAAVQRNRGEAVTIRAAYAYSFRHFWRFLGILFMQLLFAGVLSGIAACILLFGGAMVAGLLAFTGGGNSASPAAAILIGLLTILFVLAVAVACIWIWLHFCLAFPASVAEEAKAWPSIKRSSQLGKGTRGRIFVMYLLVVVMVMIVYYTLTLPVDLVLKFTLYKSTEGIAFLTRPPLAMVIFNLFVNCLERTVVMPIYAMALLLFYNDQRIRNEGYDIQLLMDQAGWSQLPAPPQTLPLVPSIPPVIETPPMPAGPAHPEIGPANPSVEGSGA